VRDDPRCTREHRDIACRPPRRHHDIAGIPPQRSASSGKMRRPLVVIAVFGGRGTLETGKRFNEVMMPVESVSAWKVGGGW
jgi:hypothetical protein